MQNDSFTALLQMSLALEFLHPKWKGGSTACIQHYEKTTCYFGCATLHRLGPHKEKESIPVHLAQHGPFALLVDEQNEEILYDFFLPRDLHMIIEERRMSILLLPVSLIILQLSDEISFDHFKQTLPPTFYQTCVQRYQTHKETRCPHV